MMGWLVAKITNCRDESVVEVLAVRRRLSEPGPAELRALVESTGKYEMADLVGPGSVKKATEWPLTAVCYTSRDKNGEGRSGSGIHRPAVRVKQ